MRSLARRSCSCEHHRFFRFSPSHSDIASPLRSSTFGLSNSFGVFQAFYKSVSLVVYLPSSSVLTMIHFQNQLAGYAPSTISWIGSVHLAIVFGTGLISGMLFDAGL